MTTKGMTTDMAQTFTVDNLKELFPANEFGCRIVNYDALVALHGDIVGSLTLGSYQGDLLYVIYDPETKLYGFVHTGYGSCSGCDALEAAVGYQDDVDWDSVFRIAQSLVPDQGRTAENMIAWLQSHDWEGEYYGHEAGNIHSWITDTLIPTIQKIESEG